MKTMYVKFDFSDIINMYSTRAMVNLNPRYRKSLTQERSGGLNRLQKMLEGANIKIMTVLSDVMGVTSRNLVEKVGFL